MKRPINFIVILLAFILLAYLRNELRGQPQQIIIVSALFSIIVPFLSLAYWKHREGSQTGQQWEVPHDAIEGISQNYLRKLIKINYKLSFKMGITYPLLIIIDHPQEVAYSYIDFSRGKMQGVIKISLKIVKSWNLQTLRGIMAHEMAHLKYRDSLKGILYTSVATFIMLIAFFFAQDTTPVVLPIVMGYYFIQSREREYQADKLAVEVTSLENVLNYMIDAYWLQEQILRDKKQRAFTHMPKFNLRARFKAIGEFLGYQMVVYSLNLINTHPSWPRRIGKVLADKGIIFSESELKTVIQRLAYTRNSAGKQTLIDSKKLSQVIPRLNLK